MSTHKYIERICCVLLALALLITVIFMNGETLGILKAEQVLGYEKRIFDYSTVHSINIEMDGWDSFIETCENEEYAACNITIDGEKYSNVAIRAKGNTSLSQVAAYGNDRYSFKVEFDHYDDNVSYYGLDKLVLNNIIQDNSYMKDFIVYQMMEQFGVASPLCSYVYITVNGEDWGLYLAVEAVEESFLQRNYGSDAGDLYKPDSMNMGGGGDFGDRGDFDSMEKADSAEKSGESGGFDRSEMKGGFGGFSMEIDEEALRQALEDQGIDPAILDGVDLENITMESAQELLSKLENVDLQALMQAVMGSGAVQMPDMGDMGGMDKGGFGMGSSDVKLQYIDDDADSYSNIFSSAKTTVTEADEQRLISSLKDLSNYENLSSVLDMESVLRYFVVHNFVVNGDSYTGSMVHNYYLYEENGALSMIPWDYNLAFGTFQGNNASSAVNDPIDSPLSIGDDRPMAYWMFTDETYTKAYHSFFEQFMEQFFADGQLLALIDSTAELIAPYVEKDPTKFCTYEEFESGVSALRDFCELRGESVSGQLDGTIPSTSEGQSADSSTLVDASGLNLSDMGSMGGGDFGGGRGNGDKQNFGDFGNFGGEKPSESTTENAETTTAPTMPTDGQQMTLPENMETFDPSAMPQMPSGENGTMPNMGDFTPPSGESPTMPDMSQMQNTTQNTAQNPQQSTEKPAENSAETPAKPDSSDTTTPAEAQPSNDTDRSSHKGAHSESMGNFSPNAQQADYSEAHLSLGISAVVLLLGLLFAVFFKRRG